jgi:hypothetical protein
MTIDEIKRLLAQAAARDARQPSYAMALAWQIDLEGITFDEASEGINRHKRQSEAYLEPVHIREQVRIIRDEKRKGTSAPLQLAKYTPPPAEQRAINSRGRDLINRALGVDPNAEHEKTLDHDDPIRDAALKRAAREKRKRARDKAINPEMARLVSQATRHIQREA